MTELWENKTLRKSIEGLRFGIPISIAIIGSIASGLVGGIGGFLAGLGISVSSKALDIKREDLSEKIVKYFSPDYQVNVFDFKKKYRFS